MSNEKKDKYLHVLKEISIDDVTNKDFYLNHYFYLHKHAQTYENKNTDVRPAL